MNKTDHPIASIKGGKYNGRTVYIDTGEKSDKKSKGGSNAFLINQIVKNKKKNLKPKEYERLIEYLNCDSDSDSENETNDNPFKEYKKEYKEKVNREIYLNDGKLIPLPTCMKDQTDACFISAPRGCGKSTMARKMMDEYREKFPKNQIVVISKCKDDPVFKGVKGLMRIDIDDEFVEDPLTLEELKDSLVVFDDYDSGFDKEKYEAICALRDNILDNGRKYGCSTIIAQHATTDYRRTRKQLFECDSYVLFPKGGTTYALKRVMMQYLGLSREMFHKLMDLPSRWIYVKKTAMPTRYCIHEAGVILL